jgi:hypothetical protein
MEYYYFQDFCDRLLLTLFPEEYVPVRAGGPNGDMKNDGYCYVSRVFFQAHATRGESAKRTKDKIETDLKGCLEKWDDVSKFVYITNDTLIGEVENYVDNLRTQYPTVKIETWGHKRLTTEIRKLELEGIEFVIDRKIILESTFSDSENLSAKFLITGEFGFIKEISENDLSNFPFENPLLFENNVLRFMRSLIGNQTFRNKEIEHFIDISKEEYSIQYPDAEVLPSEEDEYQFFYHKRIPEQDELKSNTKEDNISQFLVNNGISAERISEILTCYEGECAGEGRFEELYHLRPLYAQFLVIKNISNYAIRLKGINSIFHDGILYKSSIANENYSTQLPEFIIEPSQNLIIPIGLFLSDFQELQGFKGNLVTSTYVPEQVQYLEFGSIKDQQEIEFIGPRLVPRTISYKLNDNDLSTTIHDFSFENVYWVNRHWMCGSCPHLFFVKNGELKYQGEILNIKPNQIQKKKILIPSLVAELIIAELEQEITFINYVKINGIEKDSSIILNENEKYSIVVSQNDCIELEGKYVLKGNSYRTLPKSKKHEVIQKFKNNYAQQCV